MQGEIYDYLNHMDQQIEAYEWGKVSQEEIERWKKAFQKKRRGTIYVGKRNAAIAAVFILLLTLGCFHNRIYAQMHIVRYSIQNLLGINNDLSLYSNVVGKSVSKNGYTVTVNDVILDGNFIALSYTLTVPDAIQDVRDFEEDCEIFLYLNGKETRCGRVCGVSQIDKYNFAHMEKLILTDMDLSETYDIKLKIHVNNKKIGTIKFVARGEELVKDTRTQELNYEYMLPDGNKISFTELVINPVGAKIHFQTSDSLDYDIGLKGSDNLGNVVFFDIITVDGNNGWMNMPEGDGNYLHEEASYIILTPYALKYPEESGELTGSYQPLGKAFVVELQLD